MESQGNHFHPPYLAEIQAAVVAGGEKTHPKNRASINIWHVLICIPFQRPYRPIAYMDGGNLF